jgi:hypothetical protein
MKYARLQIRSLFDFCFGVFLLSFQWRCVVCFSMYDSVKNYLCIFNCRLDARLRHTHIHTHTRAGTHTSRHTNTHTLYLRGKCGESWWDLRWYEESCEHIVPCWEGSCNDNREKGASLQHHTAEQRWRDLTKVVHGVEPRVLSTPMTAASYICRSMFSRKSSSGVYLCQITTAKIKALKSDCFYYLLINKNQ